MEKIRMSEHWDGLINAYKAADVKKDKYLDFLQIIYSSDDEWNSFNIAYWLPTLYINKWDEDLEFADNLSINKLQKEIKAWNKLVIILNNINKTLEKHTAITFNHYFIEIKKIKNKLEELEEKWVDINSITELKTFWDDEWNYMNQVFFTPSFWYFNKEMNEFDNKVRKIVEGEVKVICLN